MSICAFKDERAFEAAMKSIARKADKRTVVPFTLGAGEWKTGGDEAAIYPYYADIPAEGLTVLHRADVFPDAASSEKLKGCGASGITEIVVIDGEAYIRIFAKHAPTDSLSGEYQISEGMGAKP